MICESIWEVISVFVWTSTSPLSASTMRAAVRRPTRDSARTAIFSTFASTSFSSSFAVRSEEHTSELQSRLHLVCRLLLEKKKTVITVVHNPVVLSRHRNAPAQAALEVDSNPARGQLAGVVSVDKDPLRAGDTERPD